MKKFLLHALFAVIVVGELAGGFIPIKNNELIFKPLIMIWIAGFFFLHAKGIDKTVRKLAGLGFLASWGGDVLLMFTSDNELFFILGIASFLAAQVFYAFLFLRTIEISGKKSFLKKQPVWMIPYIAFGLIVYIVLFPHLDAVLKVAVLVYLIAILIMASTALNRYGNGHPVSFTLVFSGALLFVLSDTLIAANKFLMAIPLGGLLIMTTYIAAQYLIMTGILKQYE
ncbi:lysoplasmalogenase [Maribellus sp. CM-23]|uniref:lysoplasmalogenase n=1 Tax=Maribellus sp. CM-23 TaxID=2781026 RepID=UPI001F2FC100|nr:lysoplasmalogenase [Maribellus sp. CM-23]MCE4562969.1 lysoplasmalogenase [Maribellus sp. CM-23]